MTREPDQLQHELDAAQADLQRHVAELKHLVEQKLEAPKHALAVVKKSFAWLAAHAIAATLGAFVLGAAARLFAEHRASALRRRGRLRLRLVGK